MCQYITEKERVTKIHWYLTGRYNLLPAPQEPYFSEEPCSCCGSDLAGKRYVFTGTAGKEHTAEKVVDSCCADCFHHLFC